MGRRSKPFIDDDMGLTPEPRTAYDCNGVPIYPGDVLKIYHFTDRRRRKHYMYKLVVELDNTLWLMDVHEIATKWAGAMKTLLEVFADASESMEIVEGYGPRPECLDFTDRPRRER